MLAGTDTTSNGTARILQLLATHQDIQTRLRDELVATCDFVGEDVPYDRLVDLPFLDAVCRETIRVCVLFLLRRQCDEY